MLYANRTIERHPQWFWPDSCKCHLRIYVALSLFGASNFTNHYLY
jgi:hypothetical protein